MDSPMSSAALREAGRVISICNACRYCEGLCATFQAMALRRAFSESDLDYLANLCHNCSACLYDCQYAPPHEFDINVPKALAELREESYARHAWPAAFGRLFERNGLVVSLLTAATLIIVLLLSLALLDPGVLFGRHAGPGAFYTVIGHGVMLWVGALSFGFSVVALSIGALRFRRAQSDRPRVGTASLAAALRDAATLRYLDGGHGDGCNERAERYSNRRRYFHHATMWGFLLCLAATIVATVYHYGLGLAAPYPLTSLPVLLGTLGGAGLVVGPAGLGWIKLRGDPEPRSATGLGMDYAFLALLFFVSLTGLLLLALRETAAMGTLLVVHLGFVFALFLVLPYGKFVHGIYRFAALLRFAAERRDSRGRH